MFFNFVSISFLEDSVGCINFLYPNWEFDMIGTPKLPGNSAGDLFWIFNSPLYRSFL